MGANKKAKQSPLDPKKTVKVTHCPHCHEKLETATVAGAGCPNCKKRIAVKSKEGNDA